MITYKPINDIDKIKEIFDNSLINDKGIYGGYIGFDENDTSVGTCLVRIDSYKCYFIFIECDFSDKLLVEGFLRAGLNWEYRTLNVYDVYLNYRHHNSGKLAEVYKRYTGKDLDNAHDAFADTLATLEVTAAPFPSAFLVTLISLLSLSHSHWLVTSS